MCTLNVRFQQHADYPLVVIANRDEFYSRPSVPPLVMSEDPAIFAPRDLEAGGTWFGINQWGLVAAVTNVWLTLPNESQGPAIQATRSRGLLTLDVLNCEKLGQISDLIQQRIRDDTYDYFNLLAASAAGATVFTHAGELREYPLSEGSATILNAPFSPDRPEEAVLPSLSGDEKLSEGWLTEIRRLLARHPDICKHSSVFGTRSSQVLALGRRSQDGDESSYPDRFWYGDGSPCETNFVDLSSPLQSILGGRSKMQAGIS
ncbi:MAG: NRDE family protein [Candidatus Neomarinimicrobiota bacterium]